jgi:hypothetical protein
MGLLQTIRDRRDRRSAARVQDAMDRLDVAAAGHKAFARIADEMRGLTPETCQPGEHRYVETEPYGDRICTTCGLCADDDPSEDADA